MVGGSGNGLKYKTKPRKQTSTLTCSAYPSLLFFSTAAPFHRLCLCCLLTCTFIYNCCSAVVLSICLYCHRLLTLTHPHLMCQ